MESASNSRTPRFQALFVDQDAALAVFRSAQAFGSVSTMQQLLIPGFGTGVGGLDPVVASRKVFQAYCRAIETPIQTEATPVVLALH